ncbi:MAG: gamma-glutamyl-gamma-aminobutyrate hydrolase family protein [Chitinophagaceae bacterium]|nr:gamma-glutamyl-gamma-aminobutyrate hydrolase family protein [Chitinophagaceae bacterium]
MKIGLTHTGNPEKHQFYLQWLGADKSVEVVELSAENDNLNELDSCDALVLSGGIDIHPKYYGASLQYTGAPEKFNQRRDEFEISAYHKAQEKELPVLGICRAMQLINVIHNGTLIQHLDNEAMIGTHKGEPDKAHNVHIKTDTLLHEIIGSDNARINSAHHQAIDKLGDGLTINAYSTDGIAEGLERLDGKGKPFLLAVQWHPERMFRFDLGDTPASKALRDRFFDEVKKSITQK